MKWEVTGADQATGKDRVIVVEANNQTQAAQKASRHGLFVSSIQEVIEPVPLPPPPPPPPSPVYNRASPPPRMPVAPPPPTPYGGFPSYPQQFPTQPAYAPYPQQNYGYPGSMPYRGKSKTSAGLLALFFGGWGIHKFYLGAWGWGVLYILFCWTFVPAIVSFIEAIGYFTVHQQTFDMKYNFQPVSAFTW